MSASIKIIESENFRATLTFGGSNEIKAITPAGKALLRLKKMPNPFRSLSASAVGIIDELESYEGKVEALKNI